MRHSAAHKSSATVRFSVGAGILATLALVVSGCAGTSEPLPTTPTGPVSAEHHLARAERCEERATEHERKAEDCRKREAEFESNPMRCADQRGFQDPTSGGARIPVQSPCWTAQHESQHHLTEARKLRKEAHEHRTAASGLVEAEKRACSGLPESDRDDTPFSHGKDISRIEPMRANGALVGVRVWFRRVPGLSAKWMSESAKCHQAQAAVLGYSPDFQPHCPLALPKVQVAVRDDAEFVVVEMTSNRPDLAATVLERAKAAVEEAKAQTEK